MLHLPLSREFAVFAVRRAPVLPRIASVITALVLCLLNACSQPHGGDTQVAAKVGKSEISVHQVNEALRSQAGPPGETQEAAARRVLDALIEQEAAAQAAHTEGLDQEPGVVQALELARRGVLARSVQDRAAANVQAPTADEIDAFYQANPNLFAHRRLYTLQEFAVEVPPASLTPLQELAKAAHSADDLAAVLAKAGIEFRSRMTVKAAEDLNESLVGEFAALGDGQSLVMPELDGALIYTIVRAQEAPLDRQGAQGLIASYLVNTRRRDAVAQRMKFLRESAHVEYVGAFASSPVSAATAPASSPR